MEKKLCCNNEHIILLPLSPALIISLNALDVGWHCGTVQYRVVSSGGEGGSSCLPVSVVGRLPWGKHRNTKVQTQKNRVGWLKKTCRFLHSLSDYCLFVVPSPLPTPA